MEPRSPARYLSRPAGGVRWDRCEIVNYWRQAPAADGPALVFKAFLSSFICKGTAGRRDAARMTGESGAAAGSVGESVKIWRQPSTRATHQTTDR